MSCPRLVADLGIKSRASRVLRTSRVSFSAAVLTQLDRAMIVGELASLQC